MDTINNFGYRIYFVSVLVKLSSRYWYFRRVDQIEYKGWKPRKEEKDHRGRYKSSNLQMWRGSSSCHIEIAIGCPYVCAAIICAYNTMELARPVGTPMKIYSYPNLWDSIELIPAPRHPCKPLKLGLTCKCPSCYYNLVHSKIRWVIWDRTFSFQINSFMKSKKF